jgi:hypothetical protein
MEPGSDTFGGVLVDECGMELGPGGTEPGLPWAAVGER